MCMSDGKKEFKRKEYPESGPAKDVCLQQMTRPREVGDKESTDLHQGGQLEGSGSRS